MRGTVRKTRASPGTARDGAREELGGESQSVRRGVRGHSGKKRGTAASNLNSGRNGRWSTTPLPEKAQPSAFCSRDSSFSLARSRAVEELSLRGEPRHRRVFKRNCCERFRRSNASLFLAADSIHNRNRRNFRNKPRNSIPSHKFPPVSLANSLLSIPFRGTVSASVIPGTVGVADATSAGSIGEMQRTAVCNHSVDRGRKFRRPPLLPSCTGRCDPFSQNPGQSLPLVSFGRPTERRRLGPVPACGSCSFPSRNQVADEFAQAHRRPVDGRCGAPNKMEETFG